MKHLFLCCFLIGMMSSIYGEYVISRTITVNDSTLAAMRSSILPGSPSHDPLIDNLSEANSIVIHDDATTMSRSVPDEVNYMNYAVNNNLNGALFSDLVDESSIRSILTFYLPQVPLADTVAALAYFRRPGEDAAGRGLHLTYYTINAAMLYDCLYYVPTNIVADTTLITVTLNNLKNILLASIHLTMETIQSYETESDVAHREWGYIPDDRLYPGLSIIQYRMQMFGAMGLAALLLRETSPELADEMNAHLDYINNVLLNQPIPETFPTDRQYPGMLAFHTTNSGAYFESMDYLGQVIQMISPFFTAYKRLSGGSINYFNNQYIVSWINDLTRKVVPTESDWSYNDDWGGSSSGPKTNPGSVFFYYNNTGNQDVRSKCSWYVKCKPASPVYASYGYACNSGIFVKYLSNPFLDGMNSVDYIPSFISQGSSNSEYTILRNPIDGDLTTILTEFKNAASMYILHENSFAPYHNQSDHLSYSFYYKGKPFLIDPGYRVGVVPSAAPNPNHLEEWYYSRQWMRSIYAHNMVMVDPDYGREFHELSTRYWAYTATTDTNQDGVEGQYRPWSAFGKYNDLLVNAEDIVRDPCFRDYFQQSENLDLLRTRVAYDEVTDSATAPIAEIHRSFVRYGELFLILDDIDALDTGLHEYSSLYQFGMFDPNDASVSTTSHGFTIQKGSDTVDIICGSTEDYINRLDRTPAGGGLEKYPTTRYFTSSPDQPLPENLYGHARGRTKVSDAGDASILAIIAPQDASNPVAVQVTAYEPHAYYGANVTHYTQSLPFQQPVSRFFGCTNGSPQLIPFGENEINTNGKLYAVSVLPDIEPYVLDQAVVILEGDHLGYDGIDLYRKYSGNDKGLTAIYSGSSLEIVFHGTTLSYPRFKVYRSGADPDQFTGIMRTQIDPNFPEPFPHPDDPNYRYVSTNIIQSLAYDDLYFYVNYGWDDLLAAGLVDNNLVIVKATIPEFILNTDLNIQGDISISGSITINNGASMDIYPNSSLLISDGVGISNHGLLNISGGASRTVSIGSASQQWSGIATYREGNMICGGAVIEGALTGVQIRGTSTIVNSEIRNCSQGISIETGTPFSVDGSRIHNNTYGIVVSNNYATSQLGYIQGNEITQNGTGILLYNSNTRISINDIHNNTRAGLYLVRGSQPIVKGCNISHTEQNGLSRPEIRLESESYPIIDDARNDINTDGLGYSLFYDTTGIIKQLKATNNYWGCTNPLEISNWIYPLEWHVVFEPFCIEPNTSFPPVHDNLFKQALAAEESGDVTLAKLLYTTIAATEPDSLYALQSLGRLNSIYSDSPSLLNELRAIYDAYIISCSDSILVKNALIQSIMIDRFDGLYLQALQGYDLQLQLSTTGLDSLLCLLDIAYTIQDMYYDDEGKGTHTGASYHSNGLNITSLKVARQTVEQLWSEILEKSENSTVDYVPVPTKLDMTIYPNPFNPSTTIAFSLPEEGEVRLSIYNLRGQRVRELLSGRMGRGFHTVVWDGKDNGNRYVSSGLHFVRIEAGKTTTVRKIMMLK